MEPLAIPCLWLSRVTGATVWRPLAAVRLFGRTFLVRGPGGGLQIRTPGGVIEFKHPRPEELYSIATRMAAIDAAIDAANGGPFGQLRYRVNEAGEPVLWIVDEVRS